MYYQLWTRCTVRRASYLPSSTTTNINFTSNQFIVQVIGWLVALHVTLPVHANIEKFLLVPLEWSKFENLFFKKKTYPFWDKLNANRHFIRVEAHWRRNGRQASKVADSSEVRREVRVFDVQQSVWTESLKLGNLQMFAHFACLFRLF